MSGRWFCPNFHVESFLRSIIQESHINHRSELSGDHFHEWAMISSKFSCREFLEIYNTREPHQSQKWAIWRPFSWVGDGFVQIFMSRVSWDLIQESHIIHRSELSGDHFMSGRWFRPNFEINNTREPHQSQILSRFSWVGDDFVQIFRSIYKSHINHRSDLSGDHFHEWAMILSKVSFMSRVSWDLQCQESHINHRSELSGDHFHEWAMISSKISCREFLEIYNTREPHHSQKWAIWRPFSWVGDDLSKFSCREFLEIYKTREPYLYNHRSELSGDHFHEWAMISSEWFMSRVSWDL